MKVTHHPNQLQQHLCRAVKHESQRVVVEPKLHGQRHGLRLKHDICSSGGLSRWQRKPSWAGQGSLLWSNTARVQESRTHLLHLLPCLAF